MYNPGMNPHNAVPPNDAVYHPQMMPSMSNHPQDMMSIHMAPQPTVMPSTSYPDPDASAQEADASTEAANQDEDAEGAGKRRRVQRACDVSVHHDSSTCFNADTSTDDLLLLPRIPLPNRHVVRRKFAATVSSRTRALVPIGE